MDLYPICAHMSDRFQKIGISDLNDGFRGPLGGTKPQLVATLEPSSCRSDQGDRYLSLSWHVALFPMILLLFHRIRSFYSRPCPRASAK
jgi:hypothetical protein